ncbi:Hyalin [Holothuria leucospilota]|uniref:Hyalin n=1 Tax=Holothuria leucospilota TaxID=206669 RepID=A0A9Q1BRJ4_HOLLE|nr:Hyalin [Holothuria leucospilota]
MSKIMPSSGFSLIWKLLLLAKCWRAQGQDSDSPIITYCPNNLKIDVPSPFQSLRVFWEEPTAVDDNGSMTVTKSHTSGAIFPADQTTIVQYVFTNSGRRSSECRFEILLSRTCDVLMPCVDNGLCYNNFRSSGECMLVPYSYTLCNHNVDTTPPQCVDVPNDIYETVELGIPRPAVFWNEPTCTDDSGKASIFSRSHSPFTFFTVGETTVLYTCEDTSGNINTCTFTVNVTWVDTTPPVSNCREDVALVIELGEAGGFVVWSEPTATDISGTAVLSTRSHRPGSWFHIGATTVTYGFTDASGNTGVCLFVVVVETEDTIPPTVAGCMLGGLKQTVGIGELGAVVSWAEPTATEISGTTILVSQSHSPGDFFPVGVTEVTYTFSDASGNTAACKFSVEISSVNTTFSSVCDNIPVDIVETVELGTNGTIINWTEPTCSDTFGNAAFFLFKSHTPPSFFTVGTTTVNYTCLSTSGKTSHCVISQLP